jgi:hypothetical protein
MAKLLPARVIRGFDIHKTWALMPFVDWRGPRGYPKTVSKQKAH